MSIGIMLYTLHLDIHIRKFKNGMNCLILQESPSTTVFNSTLIFKYLQGHKLQARKWTTGKQNLLCKNLLHLCYQKIKI